MDQNAATPGIQQKTYDAASFQGAVDLAAWDLSIACGSCHVGGGFVEKDRNGQRFSSLASIQQAGGEQMAGVFDPYLFYVQDQYDQITGAPNHVLKQAPWSFPYFNNMNPADGAFKAPFGWGQAAWGNGIQDGQLMMPNVKEMDCLFCHSKGYNNLMASVMTYSGMHFMSAMAGSGIMDTNSLSPTYQGYNAQNVSFTTYSTAQTGKVELVSLNGAALDNIKAKPDINNCKNCHAPSGLKDIPDMMRDFLSSAPMIYTASPMSPFTGVEMPAFDFNAPFGMTWDWQLGPYATSPTVTKYDIFGLLGYLPPTYTPDPSKSFSFIPSIGFPATMGPTVYNASIMAIEGVVGGGNPAGTGPLYYEKFVTAGDPTSGMDQNSLKRGAVPFPRADWFKRGDLFGDVSQEVHLDFGCAGCHMDTATSKVDNGTFDGKSQCDPGRGYDSASATEAVPGVADSRNTVKKCIDCHITGKNSDGIAINTFNAPNPTAAHALRGLTNNVVNAVGVADDSGTEGTFLGNHIDAIDCTVCHVYKKQMVVRMLDSTSGNRYPGMYGTDPAKGMMGMFTDPMPGVTNELQEWTPLYTWQKIGTDDKVKNGTKNADWRRKVYGVNIITAAVWNNDDPSVDHNGDGVPGRSADRSKVTAATPFNIVTNYDPPIARNMKAGMNYGPSGFAPIPVGFGNGQYASAFAQDGSFTGAFQYVGLYGGNINLSTPEEISAYKAFRTTYKAGLDNKDWSGVKLLYVGGPYMITHNVRRTNQYTLGKSCADCHAPNKGFFDGGFNMTGLAIKAEAGKQFMMSGAETLQVVAHKDDLDTGAELATKTGAAREVTFETLGDWNAATKTFTPNPSGEYKKILDLDRSQALYPDQVAYTAADGTVYPNREAYVAYLIAIGDAPKAEISSIGSTGVTVNPAEVTLTQGTAYTLAATSAGSLPAGNYTYTWGSTDVTSSENQVGQNVTRTFTKLGAYTLNLTVKNNNTNEVRTDSQTIKVVAPAPAAGLTTVGTVDAVTATKMATIPLSTMPAHTRLYVTWGDGGTNSYTTATASYNLSHKYYSAVSGKSYTMLVKVINGTTIVEQFNVTVTFP
ncbi:MAG: cytochrome C [Geobacter sp.]|nr:cytochrome C [Geobacter sp.]